MNEAYHMKPQYVDLKSITSVVYCIKWIICWHKNFRIKPNDAKFISWFSCAHKLQKMAVLSLEFVRNNDKCTRIFSNFVAIEID